MELGIEAVSQKRLREIRSWRYPPPYDFYDGDIDPPLNPERFFAALDAEGELVGFYYFEEKPPDLDYGLGLRPDLVGQGLGLDFFLDGLAYAREHYTRGTCSCTSPSSTSAPGAYTSARASRSSRGTCARSSASATCRS